MVSVSYLDLIKDTTLLCTLVYLLQGTLFTHYTAFPCQVCWILTASIVFPLAISALETALYRPLLILGFRSWQQLQCKQSPPSGRRLWWIKFFNFFFYPLVPALLINAIEESKQRVKELTGEVVQTRRNETGRD